LDVFLACIAKGLTLQVKSKGRDKESHKNPVSTLTMATIFNGCQPNDESKLGSRWWMRGTMPRRVAESIIQLVRDMATVGIFLYNISVLHHHFAFIYLTIRELCLKCGQQ